MSPKVKKICIIQVCTVVLVAGMSAVFFVLKGGTAVGQEQVTNTNDLVLPEYEEKEKKAKNRMEAYLAGERQKNNELRQEENTGKFNTFDFFDNASVEEEEERKEQEKAKINNDIDAQLAALQAKLDGKQVEQPQTRQEPVSAPQQQSETKTKKKSGGGGGSSYDARRAEREKEIEKKRQRQLYVNKKRMFSLGMLVDDDLIVIRQLTPEEVAMGYDAFLEAEKNKEKEAQQEAMAATSAPQASSSKKKGGRFKTMGEQSDVLEEGMIRAVIHGEQKNVTKASQVKMRILDPITVGNTTIPKNTIIYGKAGFSNNRLAIKIDNINYNNNIYPFKATIYDMDGSEGLYVPDNVINDVGKESSSNAIRSGGSNVGGVVRGLGAGGGVAGLAANGASAIVNGISNAAGRKVTEAKITLPANYKLTIKQDKKN